MKQVLHATYIILITLDTSFLLESITVRGRTHAEESSLGMVAEESSLGMVVSSSFSNSGMVNMYL